EGEFSMDPTAQTLFVEMAVTASSEPPRGRFGLETTLQLVPSQCSISGCEPVDPTAHTSLLATAAPPAKEETCFRGGGVSAIELVPLKWTASGWVLLALGFDSPTAQISLSAIAAVAAKAALLNWATTWKLGVEVAGSAPQ